MSLAVGDTDISVALATGGDTDINVVLTREILKLKWSSQREIMRSAWSWSREILTSIRACSGKY